MPSEDHDDEQSPDDELPRLLLRLDEAARSLGMSKWAVRRLIDSGELPSIRIGTTIRVAFDDLRQWVEQRSSYRRERALRIS